MKIGLKWHPDGAVIKERSQPLDRPCSHHSKRVKLCQDGMVIPEHLNMNIDTKKKLNTSSVRPVHRDADLDLPGPSMKEPNQRVEPVRMHHSGAEIPRWLKANVTNEMKLQVSSHSPQDWGEVVITHLLLPSWEVWRETHIAKMHVRLVHHTTVLVWSENKEVNATQQSCQHQHSDLSHMSQWLSKWSRKHETCDSPHTTQRSCLWSVQQKTHDRSHTSKIFQHGLRVPHSTSTTRHHSQGWVVPAHT